MRGVIARAKVDGIDRHKGLGLICVRLRPTTPADYQRLLSLVEEAFKNDSWVEVGGGAGTAVEGVTIREVPALGPIVAEVG